MTAHKQPKLIRIVTSFFAIAFLLWTLGSSTFLNASQEFVKENLNRASNVSKQISAQLNLIANHIMR